MPSLVESLSNLFSSIFHAITATLGSTLAVFQALFNTILGVVSTAFAAVGTMISGLAQTFDGLLKFLLSKYNQLVPHNLAQRLTGIEGNIIVIGAVVGALFLYGVYQKRNGRPITAAPAKKTN
jgi:phage-related protein